MGVPGGDATSPALLSDAESSPRGAFMSDSLSSFYLSVVVAKVAFCKEIYGKQKLLLGLFVHRETQGTARQGEPLQPGSVARAKGATN